jgi:hypothetical protein
MKTLKENFYSTDFGKLLKESPLIETMLLIILQIITCILPFTLFAILASVRWLWVSIWLWLACILFGLIYKLVRQRRTKEKISVSFIPKFKNEL